MRGIECVQGMGLVKATDRVDGVAPSAELVVAINKGALSVFVRVSERKSIKATLSLNQAFEV
jgi:hypothetical protein